MSEKLEEIRKKIDSLDDRIHDLLMERADLIVDVSAEKKKAGTPVVQPAREAKMIRRLLARHRGPLPEAAIVHIWRELVGAVSLLQTGLKVSVSSGEGNAHCWDMARNYFGSVLPMTRASSQLMAVSAVRENDASFAVLPWPQDGEAGPWWQHLVNQEKEKMRIVCAMPYGVTKDQNANLKDRALVISKTDYSPSGDDRTFIALSFTKKISRAKIADVFKKLNLEALSFVTRAHPVSGEDSLHLAEVGGYVEENDSRLTEMLKEFDDPAMKATVIGGYPAPPVYRGMEKKEEHPVAAAMKTGT